MTNIISNFKIKHIEYIEELKKRLYPYQLDGVDFANAGKFANNGSPRVTPYGYVLDNIISGNNAKINMKISSSAQDDTTEKSYHVVTTHIANDTQILRSDQNHMLIVKGDPREDLTVEAIASLTSQSGIKTGVGTIDHVKLSDTQVSSQEKTQFAAIMIPPRIIQASDCTEITKGTEYINKPDILPKIEALDMESSIYESKPYDTEGFTTEKLQELNDLHDEITKNEEVD